MIYKKLNLFVEAINQNFTNSLVNDMVKDIKSMLNCSVEEEDVMRFLSTDKGVRKFTIKTDKKRGLEKILKTYSEKAKPDYFLSYEIEDRGEIFSSSKGELILKLKFKKSSTRVKPPKYIYHQTDPSRVRKILELGILPTSSKGGSWNTVELKYSDSIFFATDKNFLFYPHSNKKVTLVIDTERLPKSVKFWSDYNMYQDHETKKIKYIMTKDVIPPSAIENIIDGDGKTLEIEDGYFLYKGMRF